MKREVNEKNRKLGIELEKLSKKTKKNVWRDLAERIVTPVRRRAEVNVYELSKLAKKNKGKTLVVPGKVIAAGDATEKMEVACIACSQGAKKKIAKTGGKVLTISGLLAEKAEAKKLVIVE